MRLFWAFVVLNAIDAGQTWYALTHGGTEGNPAMSLNWAMWGVGGLLGSKALGMAFCWLTLRWKWIGPYSMSFLCGFTTAVVMANFVTLRDLCGG